MRALYAAGRQAEALASYHEGRELLADQLGVDPSAQLEQVYLGILRGGELAAPAAAPAELPAAPAPAPARARDRLPPVRVPSPLTSFVGRDEDIARVLKNRLTSPVASIACVVVASYRMNPIVGHAAVRTRTAACQRGRLPCASCQRAPVKFRESGSLRHRFPRKPLSRNFTGARWQDAHGTPAALTGGCAGSESGMTHDGVHAI